MNGINGTRGYGNVNPFGNYGSRNTSTSSGNYMSKYNSIWNVGTPTHSNSLTSARGGGMVIAKRNANAGDVAKGAVSGAVLGAAIGSVVPVIGTAVGAVVGGIIGGVASLFGHHKKIVNVDTTQMSTQDIRKNFDNIFG